MDILNHNSPLNGPVVAHHCVADEVTAVVVTYRSALWIEKCIGSLADQGIVDVWVVDNASDDDTVAVVKKNFPWANIIENAANFGFGAANNQAVAMSKHPYIVFLNPDAFMEHGAVERMLQRLKNGSHFAAVGPRILRGQQIEDSLLHSPRFGDALIHILSGLRYFDRGGFSGMSVAGHPWPNGAEGDHLRGSSFMISREAIERVGGFDEHFFLYFEDTEFFLRLRAEGWRVALEPTSVVHHIGHASVSTESSLPSLEYFRGVVFMWERLFPGWQRVVLRSTLWLVVKGKWAALMLTSGCKKKRKWLHNVAHIARRPYRVPIPYRLARRPASWSCK